MNITKETRIYVVQIQMRSEEWTDTNIKEQTFEECKARVERNKDSYFLTTYNYRIIKRIETVFEEECSIN